MEDYHLIRVTEDFKIKDSFQSVYLFELALVTKSQNVFLSKSHSLIDGNLFLIAKGTDLGELIYSKLNMEEFISLNLKEFEKRLHKIDGKERSLFIHKSITKSKEEVHEYVNQIINGDKLSVYSNKSTQENCYAIKRLNNRSAIGIKINNFDHFKYQNKDYTLDPRTEPIHAAIGNENLTLFFLRQIDKKDNENSDRWAEFIIGGYKENDNLFGAPINNYHSPMIINRAFLEIENKLKVIEGDRQNYNFEESDIGSFEIKVNFLNNPLNDPEKYHEVTLISKGFSFEELIQLVQNIYDLIPPHKK